MASPFDPLDAYSGQQAIDLAALEYGNHGVRSGKVKPELVNSIREAVTAVYGPDYRVEVMSGSQPEGPRGTPGTTGSRRHGTGVAADVWVYSPDGHKLLGDELIPLSQHWLGAKVGSVGFPARASSSLHLDLIGGTGPGAVPRGKKEGPVWYYGNPSKAQREALGSALNNGTLPKYAHSPEAVRKGLIPPGSIPEVASETATAYAPQPATKSPALAAITQAAGPPPSLTGGFDSPSMPQQEEQAASFNWGMPGSPIGAWNASPGLWSISNGDMGVINTRAVRAAAGQSRPPSMASGIGSVLDPRSFSPATRNPLPQPPAPTGFGVPGGERNLASKPPVQGLNLPRLPQSGLTHTAGTMMGDRPIHMAGSGEGIPWGVTPGSVQRDMAAIVPKPPVQGLNLPVAPTMNRNMAAPIPATMPSRIANMPAIPAPRYALSAPQAQMPRAPMPMAMPQRIAALRQHAVSGGGGAGAYSPQQRPAQQQNVIRAGQYTYTRGPLGYVRVQPQQQREAPQGPQHQSLV